MLQFTFSIRFDCMVQNGYAVHEKKNQQQKEEQGGKNRIYTVVM